MALVNKAELAEILGRSERTLTTWQKQGLPIHSAGTRGQENLYQTSEVIDWLIRRELERAIGAGPDGEAISYEVERARLTKAQADHEELKVATLRGELLRSSDVERVQGAMVTAFRARALAIPTRAAPQVVGMDQTEAEAFLGDLVFEALEEMGDFDAGAYLSPNSAAREAAAENDGFAMGGREPGTVEGVERGTGTLAH